MNEPKSTAEARGGSTVVDFRRMSAEEEALREEVELLRGKLEVLRTEVAKLRAQVKGDGG